MFITVIQFPKLMVTGGDNMQQKKEINIQMGSRIRKARLQAGLTQEAFAELLNFRHRARYRRAFHGNPSEYLSGAACFRRHPPFWGYRKIPGRCPLPAAWAAFS